MCSSDLNARWPRSECAPSTHNVLVAPSFHRRGPVDSRAEWVLPSGRSPRRAVRPRSPRRGRRRGRWQPLEGGADLLPGRDVGDDEEFVAGPQPHLRGGGRGLTHWGKGAGRPRRHGGLTAPHAGSRSGSYRRHLDISPLQSAAVKDGPQGGPVRVRHVHQLRLLDGECTGPATGWRRIRVSVARRRSRMCRWSRTGCRYGVIRLPADPPARRTRKRRSSQFGRLTGSCRPGPR